MKDPDNTLRTIASLQPSQLYINMAKLEALTEAKAQTPIPVRFWRGKWVMTDGHTRAVWLLQHGCMEAKTVVDEDELDWDAYEECVRWCRDAGVNSPEDLLDRIISDNDYEKLWLDRCDKLHSELKLKRG